jgi:hypothetical protein
VCIRVSDRPGIGSWADACHPVELDMNQFNSLRQQTWPLYSFRNFSTGKILLWNPFADKNP